MAAHKESFWRRRVADPVVGLLKQGLTPRQLAVGLALGCAIGVFPVLGTTTMLCVIVAATFGLNQAAVQLTNWIVYPFQLVLLIPFVRLGEWLFSADPLPLSARQIAAVAKEQPSQMFKMFGTSLGHALAGWVVVGLPIAALIYLALVPVLRRALRKSSAVAAASAQPAP